MYTFSAAFAVGFVVAFDLWVSRRRLVTRRSFWTSYAIIVFFQLIVNGLLTGFEIVRYDPARIIGLRIVFAPVEDLFFGFAMVLLTLTLWVWAGSARAPSDGAPAAPPAHR